MAQDDAQHYRRQSRARTGAPMAVSYLMCWGDVKGPHHCAPIEWTTFVRAINCAFPLRHGRWEQHSLPTPVAHDKTEVGSMSL